MFKYIVEDNFFELNDFNEIKKYFKNSIIDTIEKDKSTTLEFDEVFKTKLKNKYQNKMINFLKKLYPEKEKLIDSIDLKYVISGENYKYPIHNDAIYKLLSIVIYISPEKNYGTFIYNSNNESDLLKEINWKPNRAFIFSRKDKGTWHSYKSNYKDKRCTVIMNLCTENLDKVIIIDRGRLYYIYYKILKFLKLK